MGAGNPLIRGYDESFYSPKTYYIDFTDCYTEESKIEAVQEHWAANELEGFDELSDDELESEFDNLIEYEVEYFQKDYFFNLEKPFDIWTVPDKEDRLISELSASFRGYAYVLAESDDCLIVTADVEIHHYPISLVPKFKLEDVIEEFYDENQDKEEWYDARNLDFEERCQNMGIKIYNKKISKWIEKYEPFMRYFHSHWKKCLSSRNGAWTSTSIKTIGDNFKFL